jgi:hypothetical protein
LGLVMKNVLLGALVFLIAACGAYQFPGASPATKGTVTGTVSVMPCGPILPAPQDSAPCRMKPAAGIELDFTSGGNVTRALSDADGRYRVQLAEGDYKVSAKGYMRIISGPATVTVKAGSTVTADYLLDSGIRRPPLPQQ